jgi:alkanesulfonate monooxygenase SsuD/methylene tetrahydromethanopterin reductase-like flavin-dependent oxidoreductase (luciferase family)
MVPVGLAEKVDRFVSESVHRERSCSPHGAAKGARGIVTSVARPSLVTSSGGPAELAEAARLAEKAGFESVWTTEFYDRSATVALAAMALATSTIGLGSAIAYAFGRTPVVLAAEARDLDELSGARLTLGLGLGTGTRRMQRDWHGLDGEHPAGRMEELVPLLRRLWRLHAGPVEHEGRFYRASVTLLHRRAHPCARRSRSSWLG